MTRNKSEGGKLFQRQSFNQTENVRTWSNSKGVREIFKHSYRKVGAESLGEGGLGAESLGEEGLKTDRI